MLSLSLSYDFFFLATQSSHIAALAFSRSSSALLAASFSSFLRFISFSRIARSYARCSSVFLGALMPSAPAIKRFATASVFSCLLSSPPPLPGLPNGLRSGVAEYEEPAAPPANVSAIEFVGGGAKGFPFGGLIGVGGGGFGTFTESTLLCMAVGIATAESSSDAASSQESAMGDEEEEDFLTLAWGLAALAIVVVEEGLPLVADVVVERRREEREASISVDLC